MLAGIIVATVTGGIAFGNDADRNKKHFEYTIGLWGDLPYATCRPRSACQT